MHASRDPPGPARRGGQRDRRAGLALAQATSYPARPITLIVPWPAGGQTDITMRILADLAGRMLGQPMVVENRPGAAGTLVGPALRGAAPDGYIIGQLPITLYRAPLQRKVAWDPLRDITPVIQISGVTFGIVVPADSGLQSFADLLAWARAHPGELTVGSTGIGSTAHLAMEDVLSREGVSYVHVPYKGTADQMLAVASKTLMVGVNSTGFAPYVDTGTAAAAGHLQRPAQQALAAGAHHARARLPRRRVHLALWHRRAGRHRPDRGAQAARRLQGRAVPSPAPAGARASYDQEPEYLDTADYGRFVQEVTARERLLLARLGISAPKAD